MRAVNLTGGFVTSETMKCTDYLVDEYTEFRDGMKKSNLFRTVVVCSITLPIVLSSVGLIGLLNHMYPVDLYGSLFITGIVCILYEILIVMFLMIGWCHSRR